MRITSAFVIAALICTPAFGAWSATQSTSQTLLGGGSEDFESGGWTSPGIADVFSIVEIDFVQMRVPAAYGDFWAADGADLELTRSADPGVFINIVGMEFVDDVTDLNFQAYSSNGDFTGFGGGINVDMFLDGGFVGATVIEMPAWSTNNNPEWVTISSDSGEMFDEIRFYNFSFLADDAAIIDNVSWVPEPSSLMLLCVAGALMARRRR